MCGIRCWLRGSAATVARPVIAGRRTAMAAALLASTFLSACSGAGGPSTQSDDLVSGVAISLRAGASGTALLLLERSGIGYSVRGAGGHAFITEVGGRAAGESEFWALYVNGELGSTGAGELQVERGDEVEWRLEDLR